MKPIRIATRESRLAMWQAHHVESLLQTTHPGLACEVVGMSTAGDRDKQSPLRQMGGKGVFIKELESGLLDGSVDIAVHSMKDVPGELPPGLMIAAIVERGHPGDAFVSNGFSSLEALPPGARIGSSSLRRVLQTREAFPELAFAELRGNVETRLRKMDDGEYDAIILAVAGLERLGLSARIASAISTSVCIPAAGQGAVGIECRSDDSLARSLCEAINHEPTWITVGAERRVTQRLGATCNLPVGVFAELIDDEIRLASFIADTAGTTTITEIDSGAVEQHLDVADRLADTLMARGAGRLLGA